MTPFTIGLRGLLLLTPVFFVIGITGSSAFDEKYPSYVTGIAGYDAVAFFTDSRAVAGTREFRAQVDGITYLFSSEENRDMFKESPEKYLPQYGGWCAYAMAKEVYVASDPEYWVIVDGKLYLNDHGAHPLWNAGTSSLIELADAFWADEAATSTAGQ